MSRSKGSFPHIDLFYTLYRVTEMANRDIWTRLRQLDAYPKTLEDFRIKTFSGATGELLGRGRPSHWGRFLLVTGLDRAVPSRSFLATG